MATWLSVYKLSGCGFEPSLHWFYINPSPPSLKIGFFSEPQKYYSFPSLTPSYLLKVTKFLVKISQFELLVVIEKKIFVNQYFLLLNLSDICLFFT